MNYHDKREAADLIICMEKICRCINDEEVFMPWLGMGVADGDIDSYTTVEDIMEDSYYMNEKNFAEIMGLFLTLMAKARKSGGLYAAGVVSTDY